VIWIDAPSIVRKDGITRGDIIDATTELLSQHQEDGCDGWFYFVLWRTVDQQP